MDAHLTLKDVFHTIGAKVVKNSEIHFLKDTDRAMLIINSTDVDEEKIIIIYDDNLPGNEKMFSLCHELGHFFLNHREKMFSLNGAAQEYEADVFAEGLLRLLDALNPDMGYGNCAKPPYRGYCFDRSKERNT